MLFYSRLASLLRNLLRKGRVERELDEDLSCYLQMLIEEKVSRGIEPGEARRQALVEIGGLEQVKERVREVRRGAMIEACLTDARYALRNIVRNPGFAVLVVLILALGLGAGSAIFSAVNAALIEPLPYREADRLLTVSEHREGSNWNFSSLNLADLKEQNTVFESLTGFDDRKVLIVTGTSRPERVLGAGADENFFEVLGVAPLLGRTFLPEECRPGGSLVAVIGEPFWRRRLASDPSAVGSNLTLNGRSYTVIGVMPSSFKIPNREEVWVPLATYPYEDDRLHSRSDRYLEVLGRLKPGADLERARAELSAVGARLSEQYPAQNADLDLTATPLEEDVLGSRGLMLGALMGGVLCLLLIACVNVANLNLTRADRRLREMAIRSAMGAGRWRLVRQLVTESLVLTILGGIGGLVLGVWMSRWMGQVQPDLFLRLNELGIGWTVFLFTAALTLLAGLSVGLVPAFKLARHNLNNELQQSTTTATGRRKNRTLGGLVLVEVALAAVLLIDAGLLVRTYLNLNRVDTGLQTENLLTAQISLPESSYPRSGDQSGFFDTLLERLARRSGVTRAAAIDKLPLVSNTSIIRFLIQGSGEEEKAAHLRVVTPGLFDALGIPLLRGRDFEPSDDSNRPMVAIVDEETSERYWPGQDPLGQQIRPAGGGPVVTVVGVVGRIRHWGPRYQVTPMLYACNRQLPADTMSLVLRTEQPPLQLAPALREEVWALDSGLPVSSLQSMQEALHSTVAEPRFNMLLFGLFSGFSLLLASLGVYGVVSYSVSLRNHELGIRLALGAKAGDIARSVLGRSLALAAGGVVLGVLLAAVSSQLLQSLLFGVEALDGWTFVLCSSLLILVALTAAALPARRAAKIDPIQALRVE